MGDDFSGVAVAHIADDCFMALLRVTKGDVLLLEKELRSEAMMIGRGQSNDIRLGDLTVSRVHARLVRVSEGRYRIEDANSTNGISLNQHRLAAPALLTDGDVIDIGAYRLTFFDVEEMRLLRSEMLRLSSQNFLFTQEYLAKPGAKVGVLVNEANNAIFLITRARVTLGNDTEADIRIPGNEQIRASISRRGNVYYVCSESPQPCVQVNGEPVMNAQMAFNDRIVVGSRRFIFREI